MRKNNPSRIMALVVAILGGLMGPAWVEAKPVLWEVIPPLDYEIAKNGIKEILGESGVLAERDKAEPADYQTDEAWMYTRGNFYFSVGCDRKVYSKGLQMPAGPRRTLHLEVSFNGKDWTAGAVVFEMQSFHRIILAHGGLGANGNPLDLLPGKEREDLKGEIALYKGPDLKELLRQVLKNLKNQGALFDADAPEKPNDCR